MCKWYILVFTAIRAIMNVVKNTVEGVKFIFTIMVCSFLVAGITTPTSKRDEGRLRQLRLNRRTR